MIKKTAQYGDLEVPDNYDELSFKEQQKELRKAAAGKQKISPNVALCLLWNKHKEQLQNLYRV